MSLNINLYVLIATVIKYSYNMLKKLNITKTKYYSKPDILQSLLHINISHIYNYFKIYECMRY